MSWKEKLDALKQRASTQTRNTTADARKLLDAMGTNVPDIQTGAVTRKHLDNFYKTAKSLGIDPRPPSITTHGWLLFLSRIATTDAGHVWHLSASIHPKGRSSSTNDWKMLGHFAAHLGAPKDAMIMPEDPTQVIHWQ